MTIKQLRAEKKLSQKAFAEMLKISVSAVAKLEKENNPSESVIKAVKEIFGVDVAAEAAAAPEKKPAAKKAEEKKAEEKKPAEKKPAEKKAAPKKPAAKKAAEEKAVEEKPAEEKKAAEEKKPAEEKKAAEEKKPAAKKAAPAKAEKKAEPKAKPAKKAAGKTVVHIQSAMGGTVTLDELLARLDAVDTVYIKVEENKAYWVKGDENGSIDLW